MTAPPDWAAVAQFATIAAILTATYLASPKLRRLIDRMLGEPPATPHKPATTAPQTPRENQETHS